MKLSDMKALAEGLAPVVVGLIAEAVAPLHAEIAELKARPFPEKGEPGERGLDGKDGRDGIDGSPGRDGADGAPGKDGRDGVDGAPGERGQDGIDGLPGKDGERGLAGEPGKDGRDGLNGKDGVGLAGAAQSREGELIVTLSDGTMKSLGVVAGKDGRDGIDGKDGADGRDGMGFDELQIETENDGRTIIFGFGSDEIEREYRIDIPVILDRGVYRPGQPYQKGDAVSWAGHLWIAQRDTSDKSDASDGWRLAVKRGRDGKDAKPNG